MPAQKLRARIFLAEDHAPDVLLIKEGVSAAGLDFQLDREADGEAALKRLLQYGDGDRPDVIIVDLNLPKVSGFGVLTGLRENPALAKVPVVILTSSKEHSDREEALRRGAAAFLSKPPDLDEFMKVVAETLTRLLRGDSQARTAAHVLNYGPACYRRPFSRRRYRVAAVTCVGLRSVAGIVK